MRVRMKLTGKLSLAISIGICLVLGTSAWFRLRDELAAFEQDIRRDHHVLGRALATAAEMLWRTEGETRALEQIETVNHAESHVGIRFIRMDAKAGTRFAPRLRDVELGFEAYSEFSAVKPEPKPPNIMISYIAVALPDGNRGAIELAQPLVHEEKHIRSSVLRTFFDTALLVLLCSGITLGFGIIFVARPLRLLIEKSRRIGAGDLSGRLVVRQGDEIRDLADEMNSMCERLAATQQRLQTESKARIRALEQLRHADRLRTVGEVASGVAHELGTPLNVVRMRANMIATGETEGEQARRAGNIIVREADRMGTIIRQLLDFGRRESPNMAPHDITRVARQAVSLLAPIAQRAQVRLEVIAEAPVQGIDVDAAQIQQAAINLLLNAIQASPPGSTVSVSITETSSSPQFGTEADEKRCVAIRINDHGRGIPPEQIARVFEPFFTTKKAGEGTGLGLSVANGIVIEHGGWINVESSLGEGSTFALCLPIEDEHDRSKRTNPDCG